MNAGEPLRSQSGPAGLEARATAVQVVDVTHAYDGRRGRVPAVAGASFAVEEGEIVALLGPSGCGKTTLLRIMAGLLSPTAGRVLIRGELVSRRTRGIALLFQQPVLVPWRTVEDNLLLVRILSGRSEVDDAERIDRLLALTGLERWRNAYPRELSLGMKQIVSFCMATLLDPRVLLMDEPFGSLDPLTRTQLGTQLLAIWSVFNTTIVLVTHSVTEAILLSDRVLVMSGHPGRIVESMRIDFPRPRTAELVRTRDFHELMDAATAALEPARPARSVTP